VRPSTTTWETCYHPSHDRVKPTIRDKTDSVYVYRATCGRDSERQVKALTNDCTVLPFPSNARSLSSGAVEAVPAALDGPQRYRRDSHISDNAVSESAL
jgi:hypothetical protein